MIAFAWPQTHTEPLSSELTIVRPSGLIGCGVVLKYAQRNFEIAKSQSVEEKMKKRMYNNHLNKHDRMASPFSCDKIFVFDPSARSHRMIVPSTDADANTPPCIELTILNEKSLPSESKSGKLENSHRNFQRIKM